MCYDVAVMLDGHCAVAISQSEHPTRMLILREPATAGESKDFSFSESLATDSRLLTANFLSPLPPLFPPHRHAFALNNFVSITYIVMGGGVGRLWLTRSLSIPAPVRRVNISGDYYQGTYSNNVGAPTFSTAAGRCQ